MKNLSFILLFSVLFCLPSFTFGQIVKLVPEFPNPDGQEVTLIYDATEGTGGLVGAEKVYIHTGVVTDGPNGTDWQFVKGNWGQDDGIGQMEKVDGEDNLWQITFSPDVRSYYEVPDGQTIFRLSMVFRNADGSAEGKGSPGAFPGGTVAGNQDIYVDLNAGNFVRLTQPTADFVYLETGQDLRIAATASSNADTLRLLIHTGTSFQLLAQATDTRDISFDYTPTAAQEVRIRVEGVFPEGTVQDERSVSIVKRDGQNIAALPQGLKQGINYHQDPTKATLVLLAPGKDFVYAVGDFSQWQVQAEYQMNKTPDGEYFWLELDNLTPGQEYVFQYWVDGVIRIGDPYADKVADPWNDKFIPEALYPGLPQYTLEQYGIATVLQTAQEAYVWQHPEVAGGRPDNEDLVIYELLIRDFIGSHSYKDMADTLSYLKTLGINAIELMPIMEFEGNESWGYNPSYFFAPDKYYGTKNDLKAFIDKAHGEGMVVILDMVLNHAFGQNAMVRMYWDQANNRPAANSPWFNPEPTHPFNVGYDFNHESPYTQQFVDDVNRYWIEEYKFDGYRFDLSKGFTQRNNPNNVGAWGRYDQSRVDLLKRMADQMWAIDPTAYVILEHFADNDEETVLANYGMMLWGNLNHDYISALNGNTSQNLNWLRAETRGWQERNLVGYMESHDEERLIMRALQEGQANGSYDISSLNIALERVKLASAFFYLVPGPKMLWQFGELGYDFPINFCPDGSISEGCRTANKPIPWGEQDGLNYHQVPARARLYGATAAIINFRQEHKEIFKEGTFEWTPSGKMRKTTITHDQMDVIVIGNFGLEPGSISPNFTKTGRWYDFFNLDSITVTNPDLPMELAPGEFRIFTSERVAFPQPGLVSVFKEIIQVNPSPFSADDQITITLDAAAADPDGTAGLAGAGKVYMVAGVVLEGPSSQNIESVVGSTNQDDGIGAMTKVAGSENLWEITLTPRAYFNVPEATIYRLGLYFRDADGTNLGKGFGGENIFLEVQRDIPIVQVIPEQFGVDNEITLIYDATQGTGGLIGASKVYMHSGIITEGPSSTSWENVIGNWGQDDGLGEMERVEGEPNRWQITITPRNYYNIAAGTPVFRLGMVFRNANGSAEGKDDGNTDIFVEVSGDPTSLHRENLSASLLLYPNPVRQHLNLSMDNHLRGLLTWTLMDVTGRVLSAGTLQKTAASGQWTIPIGQQTSGMYILQVAGDNAIATKRLLVE